MTREELARDELTAWGKRFACVDLIYALQPPERQKDEQSE